VIADHLEPKGLEPDAIPIADYRSAGRARAVAEAGSSHLLKAILKLQRGPSAPPPHRPKQVVVRLPRMPAPRLIAEIRETEQAVRHVQAVVADYFGISVADLIGPRGTAILAGWRKVAMYLSRETTDASYPTIGRCFCRDHTTVIHAWETAPFVRSLAEDIEILRERLLEEWGGRA
jgi:hypothetical protein